MAITSLAGVKAGLQPPIYFGKLQGSTAQNTGNFFSFWGVAGFPAAGTWPGTLNGSALSSPVTGQIPWTDPASGNAYLARFQAQASTQSGNTTPQRYGYWVLCDRLWHNGGIDITGASSPQAITSPTWPARDIKGTTSGEGVLLACEVSSATGVGTPTLTVGYTNSAGLAGQTGTNNQATTASQGAGMTFLFGLAAGDLGVQSVQSIALSSTWASGTINLVAYRPIALLEDGAVNRSTAIDAITGAMPRLFNGSVPYLMRLHSNGPNLQDIGTGNIQYAWG